MELARELDGLPLALSTAGAYLDNMATTVAEYIQLYRESWLHLQKTTPTLLSYDRALYSTWNISYAQVKRENSIAAMLLRLWAYFDKEDIWFELLQKANSSGPPWFKALTDDALGFNQAVRVLCDYRLVEGDTSMRERGAESGGYGMHGCVHSWTIHVLNGVHDVHMARLALRCVGYHIPESTEQDYWVVQRRLLQHAGRCARTVGLDMSIVEGDEWFLHMLGMLFSDQGRLKDAEAMYERALRGYEKVWGLEHTSTLNTVNNLGNLYKGQRRLKDAEAIYERALRGYEKVWGVEHTLTLNTVNNLGNLYKGQGRLKDTEAMYEQALRGKEKAWGPEHTSTLDTVNNLGTLYLDQGRLKDAEAMYEWALRGYEKAWGLEHTSTLNTVNNLGNLYSDQGRLKDAEAMYERALRGYEKALDSQVATYVPALNTMQNLAALYVDVGRLLDAELFYVRCQLGVEAVFGIEHDRYQRVTLALDSVRTASAIL
jgi:tetratricopeptide (TPR) repeat protein